MSSNLQMVDNRFLRHISTACRIVPGTGDPAYQADGKTGYTRCAHLKRIGEKFGNVMDVVMYQKEI